MNTDLVMDPSDPTSIAVQVMEAIQHSNWRMVAAVALIGFMALMRPRLIKLSKVKNFGFLVCLDTHLGGLVLNILTSAIGAVATAFVARKPITTALLTSSFQVALLAAGGWHAIIKASQTYVKERKAEGPKEEPAAPTSPPPAAPVLAEAPVAPPSPEDPPTEQ